ncbi:AraC family transcriptional regulator [Citrobacter koseri]|nr:AraC family transcriptional regulator [Citrobacter koseri]
MLLSLVFAPAWLGLSFYDNRTASLLRPVRRIELAHQQRGEGEHAHGSDHLSRSPQAQDIIQPLVLSLLHLCRSVVNTRRTHAARARNFSITVCATGCRTTTPGH